MTAVRKRRADFERIRTAKNEPRPAARLAAHYDVEVRLARQLAASGKQERGKLYAEVYRQLFLAIDDHPQHRGGRTIRQDRIRSQVAFLRKSLPPDATYVEIGCGDAVLTKAIAPFTAAAIGVDVTPVLMDAADVPAAFRFLRTDGTTLDLPTGSVDLVYSNQLMEHLHPDDAKEQLQEVFRVLKTGGRYICSTPNRLTGPHDISCYFGYEPAGLHLREYDHRLLSRLFRQIGFSRVAGSVTIKGITLTLPILPIALAETLLEALPRRLRARIALSPVLANLAGVTLIGIK